MVKPYLNQIGGVVDDDVSLFTGGLNSYEDKAFLEANQLPYVINMTMYKPPMMCTRPARRTLASYQSDEISPYTDGDRIIEMYSPNENEIYVITEGNPLGNKLFRLRREGPGHDFEKEPLSSDLPPYEKYYFTYVILQTSKYIYVGNENFKGKISLNDNPLSDTYTPVADDHYGIPCWHKSRLFLARPSSNTIEWSNSLMPDDFTIGPGGDSGEVYITNNRGGTIKTIVSFDDKLLVLSEHSICAIYGHSGVQSDENYFTVVDLNNNVGTHSARCTAIGGGRLFWLGDDYEVYEYTGAAINMISRPGKTRNSTLSVGGISNIFTAEQDIDYQEKAQMVATSGRLYLNIGWASQNKFLFVFDIFNKVWWCEDGEFTAIANYSDHLNRILMAKPNGDILVNYEKWADDGVDLEYNFNTNKVVEKQIEYEFHTRVFGADGVDMRKSLSRVWFQARANADVYVNDIWTSHDKWQETLGSTEIGREIDVNYRKIGTLHFEQQSIEEKTPKEIYRPDTYEQQRCDVPKMYGERVNAFQIIVKGHGYSKFYLMKREWRAR